jgi:hypothetical protein
MGQLYLKRIRDWAMAKVNDGRASRALVDPYIKLVESVDDILAGKRLVAT